MANVAADFTATVVGDKQLAGVLERFTASAANAVLRPGILAGLRVVRDEAIRTAPQLTGTLSRSIATKATVTKRRVFGKVFVRSNLTSISGPAGGTKAHDPANIAHFVEFGHGGPAPAEPHPFLRPALAAKQQEAFAVMAAKAREKLPQVVGRITARGKDVFA